MTIAYCRLVGASPSLLIVPEESLQETFSET